MAEQISCTKPGNVRADERMPPPRVWCASITSTEHPARARVMAAARPLGPEPTTTASYSECVGIFFSLSRGLFVPYLILVKHALPEIIPPLPARQWHLSEVGRTQCVLLTDHLATYAPSALISSSEPKVLETAQLVAQRLHTNVQIVDGLHEHD